MKKRNLFCIICVFCYTHVFSQDVSVQKISPQCKEDSEFSVGMAFSERSADGVINAFTFGYTPVLYNLLSEESKNKMLVELRFSSYIPIANRSMTTFKNSIHYGFGLSYHFNACTKKEVVLACYPLISHNFFKNNKTEVSFLSLQFECKVPIIIPSELSRSLYIGLGYTTTPLIYTKSESKYDFIRCFMTFGF